jgi:hypothetical protein
MNQSEKQALLDQFQEWLRSSFLPDQERRKGTKMIQAEWEAHFNRLSMAFASFVFFDPWLNRVALDSTETILVAFQDHLDTEVEQRCLEDGMEDQQKGGKILLLPSVPLRVGE